MSRRRRCLKAHASKASIRNSMNQQKGIKSFLGPRLVVAGGAVSKRQHLAMLDSLCPFLAVAVLFAKWSALPQLPTVGLC